MDLDNWKHLSEKIEKTCYKEVINWDSLSTDIKTFMARKWNPATHHGKAICSAKKENIISVLREHNASVGLEYTTHFAFYFFNDLVASHLCIASRVISGKEYTNNWIYLDGFYRFTHSPTTYTTSNLGDNTDRGDKAFLSQLNLFRNGLATP